MVTMRSVALTLPTGTEQERFSSPLMCTEQAPHCATPQPYLVPVRPACSRIAHSRGVLGSTLSSRDLPLIVRRAIGSSLPGLLCGAANIRDHASERKLSREPAASARSPAPSTPKIIASPPVAPSLR